MMFSERWRVQRATDHYSTGFEPKKFEYVPSRITADRLLLATETTPAPAILICILGNLFSRFSGPTKDPAFGFTVPTSGLGCPFWGENVCPFYVLQPQKGHPRPEV
jgi:hypothetical protein